MLFSYFYIPPEHGILLAHYKWTVIIIIIIITLCLTELSDELSSTQYFVSCVVFISHTLLL